ncbi:MAG: hypothetical protein AB7G93_12060 [Bdellovibrionales bacterium]
MAEQPERKAKWAGVWPLTSTVLLFLILGLLIVNLVWERSVHQSVPKPIPTQPAGLHTEYLEQIRSLTSLLKDTLDLVAEQRREILELRDQIRDQALENDVYRNEPSGSVEQRGR